MAVWWPLAFACRARRVCNDCKVPSSVITFNSSVTSQSLSQAMKHVKWSPATFVCLKQVQMKTPKPGGYQRHPSAPCELLDTIHGLQPHHSRPPGVSVARWSRWTFALESKPCMMLASSYCPFSSLSPSFLIDSTSSHMTRRRDGVLSRKKTLAMKPRGKKGAV